MDTIKKENIQISDNGGPAAAGSPIQTTAATSVLRDESQIEKSVHSQSQLKTKQSWFRKSNTCGSLYAKCACSNGVESSSYSGQATGSSTPGTPEVVHGRPISTSEKDFRKIRVLQAFVHPDTTTIFTSENCYPGSDSPTRTSLITSAQAGDFQILHSTHHSKRQSTPNCGTCDYAAAFHPEFVLKKLAPKKTSNQQDGRTASISIPSPRKVPLKKSSKSYPGLSPSDSSVESIIRAFGQRSTSSSVEEVTEEEDSREDLTNSYISFTANSDPPAKDPPEVCESDIQLEERSDSSNSTSTSSSPPSQLLNNHPNNQQPTVLPLNPSAHEFFIQSGILGPMGNGSSVLLRKTSKIVPNVDAPVKEKVSATLSSLTQVLTRSWDANKHRRSSSSSGRHRPASTSRN